MQARQGDGPTSAFLATSYAAISGNVDALFGNVTGMMSMGGGAPSAPRASIQSVESEGAFLSAMKTVSGWFGGDSETVPRVRPVPGS